MSTHTTTNSTEVSVKGILPATAFLIAAVLLFSGVTYWYATKPADNLESEAADSHDEGASEEEHSPSESQEGKTSHEISIYQDDKFPELKLSFSKEWKLEVSSYWGKYKETSSQDGIQLRPLAAATAGWQRVNLVKDNHQLEVYINFPLANDSGRRSRVECFGGESDMQAEKVGQNLVRFHNQKNDSNIEYLRNVSFKGDSDFNKVLSSYDQVGNQSKHSKAEFCLKAGYLTTKSDMKKENFDLGSMSGTEDKSVWEPVVIITLSNQSGETVDQEIMVEADEIVGSLQGIRAVS